MMLAKYTEWQATKSFSWRVVHTKHEQTIGLLIFSEKF